MLKSVKRFLESENCVDLPATSINWTRNQFYIKLKQVVPSIRQALSNIQFVGSGSVFVYLWFASNTQLPTSKLHRLNAEVLNRQEKI